MIVGEPAAPEMITVYINDYSIVTKKAFMFDRIIDIVKDYDPDCNQNDTMLKILYVYIQFKNWEEWKENKND